MKKNITQTLLYVTFAISTVLIITVYLDKEKDIALIYEPDDTQVEPDEEMLEPGSSGSSSVKPAITQRPVHSEKSKLRQQCLEHLEAATELVGDGNITLSVQARIFRILNTCVYEIENELALTERLHPDSVQDAACLNSINQIRDYLLDLGVAVQGFSELPNDTEYQRENISTEFFRIRNDIISNGELAMKNRVSLCTRTSG